MRQASSGRSGPGVTDHKVGDEVVLHCNHLVYPGTNDIQTIWGYETPDGSFAPVHEGSGAAGASEAAAAQLGGSRELRPHLLQRRTECWSTRAKLQPGEDVLVWGGQAVASASSAFSSAQ